MEIPALGAGQLPPATQDDPGSSQLLRSQVLLRMFRDKSLGNILAVADCPVSFSIVENPVAVEGVLG